MKKATLLTSTLIFIALVLCHDSCRPVDQKKEEINLCNAVLDQIVTKNLYHGCMDHALLNDKYQAFLKDESKFRSYKKSFDSLVAIRKANEPKCIVAYSNNIGNLKNIDSTFLKMSISGSLDDDFVRDFFGDFSIRSVTDSLSKSSEIHLNQFSINYIDFVPYDQTRGLTNGAIGMIAFSKVVFDNTYDNAILYFEFYCGHQCWHGKLIFARKYMGSWIVKKTKDAWDT